LSSGKILQDFFSKKKTLKNLKEYENRKIAEKIPLPRFNGTTSGPKKTDFAF